mmetsp:Transcript_14708/g.24684  ORF Transcript_14708/g.24684 Transcript_14708/m.24684 type:complete len:310 (+) Transcript_14708:56-985(+)
MLSRKRVTTPAETLAYLVPRGAILDCDILPTYEQVQSSLVDITSFSGADIPVYCYVSYRWMYSHSPDNSFQTLFKVLKQFMVVYDGIEYFWIDLCCLPSDQTQKRILLASMCDIIQNASKLLMMPFSPSKTSYVPTYDLQSFCFRAWAVLEYSFFIGRPEDVVIARILRSGKSVRVKYVALPHASGEENTMNLVNSFVVLKDLIFRNDFASFETFYSSNITSDKQTVWDKLVQSGTVLLNTTPDAASFMCKEGAITESNGYIESHFEHALYAVSVQNGVESCDTYIPKHKKKQGEAATCENCEINCTLM